MTTFRGKVALVTGASSGIGRAVALRFAEDGASVGIVGLGADALDEVAESIQNAGGEVLARRVDVRQEQDVAQFVSDLKERFGRLDILINNAGVAFPGGNAGIASGRAEEWQQMLDVNILGVLLFSKHGLQAMGAQDPPGGHIVNISSKSAETHSAAGQVYGATKAAVNALTRGLRDEARKSDVKVTVVLPGQTLTNIWRRLPQEKLDALASMLGGSIGGSGIRRGEHVDPGSIQKALEEHPGAFLAPDHVAEAVAYAVSQPGAVHVEELVLGPAKPLGLSRARA